MKKTRAARFSRGIKKLSPRFKRFSLLPWRGRELEDGELSMAPFDSRRFYARIFFFIARRETRDARNYFLECEY